MEPLYGVSAEAQNDLFEIWRRIAEDSVDLANRIEDEFHRLFASLGSMPGQGHVRRELTSQPVLFFPLYSFLVVYEPEARPIRIMAVLRGKRDLKQILKKPFEGRRRSSRWISDLVSANCSSYPPVPVLEH
jgi:antitoxin ParD1/3/4/toxin ParE1/3/4